MIKRADKDNGDDIHPVGGRMIFYVVAFADATVMDMLNLMRFAAAPDAKRQAHLTVRGPYHRRLPQTTVRRLSQNIEGENIAVKGAGVFFAKQQNTVFLHCHSPAIKAVWHKPHLPYTPHLTIYDGKSRAVAKQIYHALANANINLTRPATAIHEIISPTTTSDLRPAIRAEVLTQITNNDNITTPNQLATANYQTRLKTLTTTANHLASLR